MECRYCGNGHAVTELCRPRRVGRRMFCFALGTAAVGALLPACPAVDPVQFYSSLYTARWDDSAQLFLAGMPLRMEFAVVYPKGGL